ncbi:MAG: hypothetical protein PHQ47_03060 [Candidatus Portnoybacteria bacterium]|nr:hypothetical protein [Candidatus Portnoybacteria bacterium]
MLSSKLFLWGLTDALGAFVYISGVAWLMSHMEKVIGKIDNNFFGPVAILLLFVISATIVGALVLGRPIVFYLNGAKKDSLKLFSYTLVCLVGIAAIVFISLALR